MEAWRRRLPEREPRRQRQLRPVGSGGGRKRLPRRLGPVRRLGRRAGRGGARRRPRSAAPAARASTCRSTSARSPSPSTSRASTELNLSAGVDRGDLRRQDHHLGRRRDRRRTTRTRRCPDRRSRRAPLRRLGHHRRTSQEYLSETAPEACGPYEARRQLAHRGRRVAPRAPPAWSRRSRPAPGTITYADASAVGDARQGRASGSATEFVAPDRRGRRGRRGRLAARRGPRGRRHRHRRSTATHDRARAPTR